MCNLLQPVEQPGCYRVDRTLSIHLSQYSLVSVVREQWSRVLLVHLKTMLRGLMGIIRAGSERAATLITAIGDLGRCLVDVV